MTQQVRLFGVSLIEVPWLLVLEYLPYGDLKKVMKVGHIVADNFYQSLCLSSLIFGSLCKLNSICMLSICYHHRFTLFSEKMIIVCIYLSHQQSSLSLFIAVNFCYCYFPVLLIITSESEDYYCRHAKPRRE